MGFEHLPGRAATEPTIVRSHTTPTVIDIHPLSGASTCRATTVWDRRRNRWHGAVVRQARRPPDVVASDELCRPIPPESVRVASFGPRQASRVNTGATPWPRRSENLSARLPSGQVCAAGAEADRGPTGRYPGSPRPRSGVRPLLVHDSPETAAATSREPITPVFERSERVTVCHPSRRSTLGPATENVCPVIPAASSVQR